MMLKFDSVESRNGSKPFLSLRMGFGNVNNYTDLHNEHPSTVFSTVKGCVCNTLVTVDECSSRLYVL